ncbi:hypothetical protein B0H11DRAFT_2012893 [Mycena galericulata]|nr:hypothetical protein B0H11DRAFT_2012893 [Mycena galericulata]
MSEPGSLDEITEHLPPHHRQQSQVEKGSAACVDPARTSSKRRRSLLGTRMTEQDSAPFPVAKKPRHLGTAGGFDGGNGGGESLRGPGVWGSSVVLATHAPLQAPAAARQPRPRTARASTARPLAEYLAEVLGFNLSKYSALMDAQGFSVARLGVMATWREPYIEAAVDRLLDSMPRLDQVALRFGIRKLKASRAEPRKSVLPPRFANPSNTAATLPGFLKQVMGFDLRAHHLLLKKQGYDVFRLSAMAAWSSEDVAEALQGTLGRHARGVGPAEAMKPLELVAMEFALSEFEWPNDVLSFRFLI